MKEPPPGYDDHHVITRDRLKMLVLQLEGEMNRIDKIARKNLPIAPQLRMEFENNFWQFRHSAEELGENYSAAVEKLIQIYSQFLVMPSEEKLAQVMKELSQLKTLLEVS